MAVNPWAHRTGLGAPRQRPNMRGTNLYQMAAPHARQVAKNNAARQIPNIWPIPRNRDKTSRGLHRNGNTCFRLSGLQALLHLPKFLQWILSHNSMHKGVLIFPCRPTQVIHTKLGAALTSDWGGSSDKEISSIDNLSEKAMAELEKKLEDQEAEVPGSVLTRCPACAVKALVQCYWGARNLRADGTPMALPLNNAELNRVHNVDNMLRVFTPGAAFGNANAQEDPEEMQTRLLNGCLESVNYNLQANREWRERYEALFILQLEMTWKCQTCATVVNPLPPFTNVDGIGFNAVPIQPNGTPDSVQDAIRRTFTPQNLGHRSCTQCPTPQPKIETIRIEGSPEYFRIKLTIVNGAGHMNNNPVALPDVLDLSQYQAVGDNPPLLKYRLSSVLSHAGSIYAGHWAASVRGPKNVFSINDNAVHQRNHLFRLRQNPQDHGGTNMQAVVLMYKRFEKRL